MSDVRVHWVGRHDHNLFVYRLFRVMWEHGRVGFKNGYSAKLSVGLTPMIFKWYKEQDGWILIVCGVRLHYRRSYGGKFV